MYHAYRKPVAGNSETVAPVNCFVERTGNWLWIIVIFVFAAIVCAIVTSSKAKPVHYSTGRRPLSQRGRLQNTALARCPYCPGFLDSQGRCNILECPIYSPDWGKAVSASGIPVRRVLIKELAMEVGAMEGKGSVVVFAVYPGSNAEKAGLCIGDKIVRFNGRKTKSVKQFESVVARAKPESNVEVKVARNGREIKAFVMIGEGEMEGVTVPTPPR
jgi:membrane-associated protease RseP (regulator of RpoE activity)